ncbi:MAG: glycerol-3-phosphate cytidylyltransferase, partial [Lachnospiraceae bacterium]|nr:glycerol-3-phosphate cytidylyltransferase [Lachnospiraceae bacterium]
INDEDGLDLVTKVSLEYPAGIATATCGLGVKSEGRLLIAGTKGYIVAEAPWWKTSYFEVHYEDEERVEKYSETFLGDGLRYEISDFLSMINGNNNSEFKLTRGESIALAEIMEMFLQEKRENRGRQT